MCCFCVLLQQCTVHLFFVTHSEEEDPQGPDIRNGLSWLDRHYYITTAASVVVMSGACRHHICRGGQQERDNKRHANLANVANPETHINERHRIDGVTVTTRRSCVGMLKTSKSHPSRTRWVSKMQSLGDGTVCTCCVFISVVLQVTTAAMNLHLRVLLFAVFFTHKSPQFVICTITHHEWPLNDVVHCQLTYRGA